MNYISYLKNKYDLFIVCLFALWILSCLLLKSDDLRFVKGFFSGLLAFIGTLELLVRRRINILLLIGVSSFLCVFMIYSFFCEFSFTGLNFTAVQIYWLTPICSLLIASLFYNHRRLYYLEKFFIYLIGILLFYNYWFIFEKLGFLPKIVSLLQPKTLFSMGGAYMFARTGNEGSYSFFLPVFFYLFMVKALNREKSKMLFFMLVLSFFFIAICGRRILTLVCLVSFCFILLNKALSNPKALKRYFLRERKLFILLFIAFLFSIILYFDFYRAIYNTVFELINQFDDSNSARVYKYVHLMQGWLYDGNSFLFGNGLTAELGKHEWVYLALCYQTGIIGFLFCSFCVFAILWYIYLKVNSNIYYEKVNIAITLGFICFLVAGGTNPMVTQLWAWTLILIPLIPREKSIKLINHYENTVLITK